MHHQKTSSPGSDGRLPGLSTTGLEVGVDAVQQLADVGAALKLKARGVGDRDQARGVPIEEGLCLHVLCSVFGRSPAQGELVGTAPDKRGLVRPGPGRRVAPARRAWPGPSVPARVRVRARNE